MFGKIDDICDIGLGVQLLLGEFHYDMYVNNFIIDMYVKCGFYRKRRDLLTAKSPQQWEKAIGKHTLPTAC